MTLQDWSAKRFEANQIFTPSTPISVADLFAGRSAQIFRIIDAVGGVMVTLAAMCNTLGVDIGAAAETELARIWTKVDAIRAKQAAKPTGSALPIAALSTPEASDTKGLVDALEKVSADLIDQQDEPWTEAGGASQNRVHFWRDKAIDASRTLREALDQHRGSTR